MLQKVKNLNLILLVLSFLVIVSCVGSIAPVGILAAGETTGAVVTDPPKTEAPKTDPPPPKTDPPPPKTEAPKPKTDPPKPKTEAPKPKTEAPKPKTDPPPQTEPPQTEPPEDQPPQTEPPEVLDPVTYEEEPVEYTWEYDDPTTSMRPIGITTTTTVSQTTSMTSTSQVTSYNSERDKKRLRDLGEEIKKLTWLFVLIILASIGALIYFNYKAFMKKNTRSNIQQRSLFGGKNKRMKRIFRSKKNFKDKGIR